MKRAPLLAQLFSGSIVTEEVDLATDVVGGLLPEEAAGSAKMQHGRLLEYTAGRHCARVALARFGVRGAPILRGDDRAPVWPPGFVGSITHTRLREGGWCGAAVAARADARSVGIDAEFDSALEKKLWNRVLTPSERGWLSREPDDARGLVAKLVFSAKESVYKCQYPLSGQFLEFAEVELPEPPREGRFSAILRREAPPFHDGHVFEGRYARRDGLIVTGVTLD